MSKLFKNIAQRQEDIAQRVQIEDDPSLEEVKYIGAFEIMHKGPAEMIVAAVVTSWPELEVIEKTTLTVPTPLKYIPRLVAFREGPGILQTYYDLEYDPQLIIVSGQGISHPLKAGLANFVGVELDKPCIGISKTPMDGDIVEDDVVRDKELVAKMVKTREHANPLCVSPGHKISVQTAAEWIEKLIVPPHKRPEPSHIASRIAKKAAKKKETSEDEEILSQNL